MNVFEEAGAKEFSYWLKDPILLSVIRSLLKKFICVHGVKSHFIPLRRSFQSLNFQQMWFHCA